MAKKRNAYIGIDIGGTKSLFALFDEKFARIAEVKQMTHAAKGGRGAFRTMVRESVGELLQVAKRHRKVVAAIGVGCAGIVEPGSGTIRVSPNAAFLRGFSFAETLAPLTDARVCVLNDVQAGLYGELELGAARKARHVIGIFIGTGIGGALAIDGRIYTGAGGVAGDIGNYLLHAMGPLAGSLREGVLDDVASRTAIAGDAAVLAAKRWAPKLRAIAGTDVTAIKSTHLARAIEGGDKAVEKLVRSRARVVGIALSNLVDFLNPQVLVLGGGLVEAMPSLIRNEVRKGIEAHATPVAFKDLKVRVAKLGDHAVTTGAAHLAADVISGRAPMPR